MAPRDGGEIDLCSEFTRVAEAMAPFYARGTEIALEDEAIQLKYITYEEYGNGGEEIADEVGYELYLKTGFDPASYTAMFEKMVGTDRNADGGRVDCVVEKMVRGTRSHPGMCWRTENIKVTEQAEHADSYGPYAANKTLDLPGSQLAAAKAEIETLAASPGNGSSAIPEEPPSQGQTTAGDGGDGGQGQGAGGGDGESTENGIGGGSGEPDASCNLGDFVCDYGGQCNLRAQPGKSDANPVIGQIGSGEGAFEICEVRELPDYEKTWYRILHPSLGQAWVWSGMTSK